MTEQPDHTTPADPFRQDDQGAALERSAEAIREAQEAGGRVAAHDDIATQDRERAGELSEDPDGTGGHP